ncbi:MAG: TetR/AcrR family transcriptional regulator [Chloracidobacterium sp.]|uniref:TetR family transcriptional regulator n=1 Tax=Chloracidobacterium validum TaxID=2821543 RepID=A0ABX8BGG2_9BACT|nr:TetR/AcrR family transcriptional regulator [Chloracidobacterium validum]QUW04170.1 TetR family transcriptional regulator [Chloracidobacterium validum]
MRYPPNKATTTGHSTREALLRATVRVVAEQGLPKLTLEAVARAAGVSKGGLLYHFPTKEALVQALIETFIAEWDALTEREYARDPEPEKPGRWLRAYVRASFAELEATESFTLGLGQGDMAGFLVALAVNPELLGLIQSAYRRWHRLLISDGIDEATATAVRFAADGIYFAEGFGLAPPTGRARRQVCQTILDWIHAAAPARKV